MEMEPFFTRMCRLYSLREDEAKMIIERMKSTSFKKGDYIVREGERTNNLYLLRDGVWRCFRNNDGQEITMWFAFGGEIVCPVWGYMSGAPSKVTIEAESESEVYYISKDEIEAICNKHIEAANLLRRIFESHALLIEEYLLFWTDNVSAKKRYLAMMKREPDLLKKVPLKKLASYLFLTPQSLSRIRAGINKKE